MGQRRRGPLSGEDTFMHEPVQEAGQKRQCHFKSSSKRNSPHSWGESQLRTPRLL